MPLRIKNEIGTLAAAFNQMVRYLAQSKEELDQYSKTLEEKMKQRTNDLERRSGFLNKICRKYLTDSTTLNAKSRPT